MQIYVCERERCIYVCMCVCTREYDIYIWSNVPALQNMQALFATLWINEGFGKHNRGGVCCRVVLHEKIILNQSINVTQQTKSVVGVTNCSFVILIHGGPEGIKEAGIGTLLDLESKVGYRGVISES